MRTTIHARGIVFAAGVVLALIATASPAEKPIAGTLQGKIKGQPAVTLSVKAEGNKLSGAVIFYLLRDDGGSLTVAGKTELPLIDPKFDGKALSFQVKHDQPEKLVAFEMKLVGENEGELKQLDDDEPNMIKMIMEK